MKTNKTTESVFRTMEIDIDGITEDVYQNMSRDQKGILLWMLSNKEFDFEINFAREKLGIPKNGWPDPSVVENYYGDSLVKFKQGYTKEEIRRHNEFDKNLIRTVQNMINKFGIDSLWSGTLADMICFCKFTPPRKYELHLSPKRLNPIIHINYVAKSPNDFIRWVRKNWPFPPGDRTTEWFDDLNIKQESRQKQKDVGNSIRTIPQFSNLKEYVKMLRWKNIYKLSYSKIAFKVNDEDRQRTANTIQNLNKAMKKSKDVSNHKQKLIKRTNRL